jgi:hypothetical protein
LQALLSLDTSYIQSISNHPVHIVDSQGNMSPSSFIPFCEFGGNIKVLGEDIPQLDYPVCNKFKPKIRNGQLCYQVDVNEFKDQILDTKDIKRGLTFAMDYNSEKMIKESSEKMIDISVKGFYKKQRTASDKAEKATIYVETLGRMHYFELLKG